MNKIHTLAGQPEMQVEVILASFSLDPVPPIYTIRMRYPRIIHSEIMTHRLFSRNARSSRAVPVQTMLNEVREKPFVPWHWGKNQKGMQAGKECNETVSMMVDDVHFDEIPREEAWLYARDCSLETADSLSKAGYHKQIPNRLLEPFMWMDTLITSTDWSNFLWLRDHKDAEPHLQDLARLVDMAIAQPDPQELEPGEWHLPYITKPDLVHAAAMGRAAGEDFLKKISAARCARISYKPFDGDASYEREIERYNSLVNSDRVHSSPTEHQATPDTRIVTQTAFFGSKGKRLGKGAHKTVWENPHLHGNFTGWCQYRKSIPNERR